MPLLMENGKIIITKLEAVYDLEPFFIYATFCFLQMNFIQVNIICHMTV